MPIIDLMDPEQRKQAVASGLIWSGPQEAVLHALRDIRDGLIPAPSHIPAEWRTVAEDYGITAAAPEMEPLP